MSTEQADAASSDVDDVAGDAASTDQDEAEESEPRVVKGEYSWEDFKTEYFYDDSGEPPTQTVVGDDGEHREEPIPFDASEYLGFDDRDTEGVLSHFEDIGSEINDLVDERTVDVNEGLDEDAFFSDSAGETTITNRYDLEKAVPMEKKKHFQEVERYWVNEPYAFVIIFHSRKENEKKYYLVEPFRTEIEREFESFLTQKLRNSIKYSSREIIVEGSETDRRNVIETETRKLLDRYGLYSGPVRGDESIAEKAARYLVKTSAPDTVDSIVDRAGMFGSGFASSLESAVRSVRRDDQGPLDGLSTRPEPVLLEENAQTLNQYQVEKLLYRLKRDFIGFERIDGVKHDINVEDISCDGYNSPVFVYHSEYEQLISNIEYGVDDLDNFVVKMAQRSGKGISKRHPQVDATLPDGSRAQLTLGREVSDHGTNYTIRQFKEIPFTPIDLINWKTFSLDEMAFLWLCIENHKSLIFAGGTASGKTTSLNAVSLFIPSNAKLVSIEDTREVELPQRNWIASVTRPAFGDDDAGDVDEFDLLEAALRQRPDYIVMGEIRGEEGRTLFQVMSTGHTTLTTFHADSVGEVLKRFTTEPINVSKTLFTALDLVSIQSSTRVRGRKVRRNRSITEINKYDAENDEINVNDVYQWEPEQDIFRQTADSSTLDQIRFDRGWTYEELDDQLFRRRVVLAYLIENNLNKYPQVAATTQAFINDQDTILTLIANDKLAASLEDLRGMESVLIDVDEDLEAMVPRPDPSEEMLEEAREILDQADDLLEKYRGEESAEVAEILMAAAEEAEAEAEAAAAAEAQRQAAQAAAKEAETGESDEAAADSEPATDDIGDFEPASAGDETSTGQSDAVANGGFGWDDDAENATEASTQNTETDQETSAGGAPEDLFGGNDQHETVDGDASGADDADDEAADEDDDFWSFTPATVADEDDAEDDPSDDGPWA